MKEGLEEYAVASVGGDQPTQRDIPRDVSRELVPGDQIRKGAPKMQLREWEEAALELVRSCVLNVSACVRDAVEASQ